MSNRKWNSGHNSCELHIGETHQFSRFTKREKQVKIKPSTLQNVAATIIRD